MKLNTSVLPKAVKASKQTQIGYRVWHFALAVPALGFTLQLTLGSLPPIPKEHTASFIRYTTHSNHTPSNPNSPTFYQASDEIPAIEIFPLNLRGETTGPLLAKVIKDYLPETTDAEAIDLGNTLPPGSEPRMIVIVPKDSPDPVF